MPGLGFTEVLFIFVAALLLFGPRRLPQIGRTLGKGLAEFRKASDELKRTIDAEGLEEDLRQTRQTIEAVDPRRYLKEAMKRDAESGRVARDRRPGAPEPVGKSPGDALLPEDDAAPTPATDLIPDRETDDGAPRETDDGAPREDAADVTADDTADDAVEREPARADSGTADS